MLKQGLALVLSSVAVTSFAADPTPEMQKRCNAEGEVYAFYALARSTGVTKESSLEGLSSGNFSQDQVTLRKEAIESAYGEQSYANPTLIKEIARESCIHWQTEAATRGMSLDQTTGTLRAAVKARAVEPSQETKVWCENKTAAYAVVAEGRDEGMSVAQWLQKIEAQPVSDALKEDLRAGVIVAYKIFPNLGPKSIKDVTYAQCLANNRTDDEQKALSEKK
ncbi:MULTISPECIES: hypothetical protein [Pseudomonas]|uniref:Uncharacterized protein n=1 Tax=Pseudomonas nitroreducens TaxID=46680 RepID=A0A6G6JAT5_PSENT|nr:MULTISPECIES: hypothetical protein [Pseudomonas]MDU4254061.1 hypothetical protein [Pseudomonas sp.]QIE91581.1 hypothetical protein G5B91_35205 [Pseudomonas nitroreducens]